jgi:Zn-dependent protease with chaperone function
MKLFNRAGGIVLLGYYLFSALCFFISTFGILNFKDVVKLFLFWPFGRNLFRFGYILSIKYHAQRIVKKLSEVSGFREKIKVIVFDLPVINAFAFKKGGALNLGLWGKIERYIALTTEIAKFSTKDELSFVIAHEFAHHYKNHFVVGALGQFVSQMSLTTLLLKPFSMVGLLSTVALAVSATLLRRQEKEADLLGVQFLRKAGYPCYGGITFFQKLLKLVGTGSSQLIKLLDFLFSDHPDIEERIRKLEGVQFKVFSSITDKIYTS